MLSSDRMATVGLTVLPDARTLQVEPGTTILRAAHAAGVEVTATCGGRGHLQHVSRTAFGEFVRSQTCPGCAGAGRVVVEVCDSGQSGH